MKIIAFVGPSGTGKSHRALTVASKLKVELIIDDGLLVHKGKVAAGRSAKGEITKLEAVRRAIFANRDHADEVIKKIQELKPDKILIIGTSEKMVKKISDALGLPYPYKIIKIDEVASIREMETAKQVRKQQGKHVIPVPTFEIKRYFSGYLLDPLRIFMKRKNNSIHVEEKSVVRPTYSYFGKFTISDKAIISIISHEAVKVDGIVDTGGIFLETNPEGVIVYLDVFVKYGKPVNIILKKAQQKIIRKIEYITALNVISLNITATKIVVE